MIKLRAIENHFRRCFLKYNLQLRVEAFQRTLIQINWNEYGPPLASLNRHY